MCLRLLIVLACAISLVVSQTKLFQSRRLTQPRALRGADREFELPDGDEEEDDLSSTQMCPVSLTSSFDLIRGINNYRIIHNLPPINISRSLMSTSCAHMRDITASKQVINGDCGLHSWSSCCYPSDHSNPNCMHRKALQVTTALKWNLYNVAAYELAYEWTGGEFSPIRAVDMFAQNEDHRKFILQEGAWSEFKWRAIGAAVGNKQAYIWFGTLPDPNGDFDQFHVDKHVMELPGCTCTESPVTWMPPPTLSPEQQAILDHEKKLQSMPMYYTIEQGPLETWFIPNTNNMSQTTAININDVVENLTATQPPPIGLSILSKNETFTDAGEALTTAPSISHSNESTIGISLSDFLKGLTLS